MSKYELLVAKPFLHDDETGEGLKENIKVARVSVPKLPRPHHEVVRNPVAAVVCAYKYNDGWAFVGLSAEQKHEIGDVLIEKDIPMNVWVDIVIE
jgi:hypothetical protein